MSARVPIPSTRLSSGAMDVRHEGAQLGDHAIVVDTVVAFGGRDEDRVSWTIEDGALWLALADGAGGTSGGRDAASLLVMHEGRDASEGILEVDCLLASRAAGECTAVRLAVRVGDTGEWEVEGASVGDSRAWARHAGRWEELTSGQRRKPLVGSGGATPVTFSRDGVDALLLASDGLGAYASEPSLLASIDAAPIDAALGHALVDLVRLPTGTLRDDVSAIVVRTRRNGR